MEPSEERHFALHRKVHCKPLGAACTEMEKYEPRAALVVLETRYIHSVPVAGTAGQYFPGCTALPTADILEYSLPFEMEDAVPHKMVDGLQHKDLILRIVFHHSMPGVSGNCLVLAEVELQDCKHGGYTRQNEG